MIIYFLYVIIIFSSTSGSDCGAYAVLTGTMTAPAVPDEFSRRFPLDSNPAGSSSEEKERVLVMRDMRHAAPRASVGGEWATFTGFNNRKENEMCIDFVFGRSDGVGWCVSLPPTFFLYLSLGLESHDEYREAKGVFVETALSDDGMLASDHRLVVADVVIR